MQWARWGGCAARCAHPSHERHGKKRPRRDVPKSHWPSMRNEGAGSPDHPPPRPETEHTCMRARRYDRTESLLKRRAGSPINLDLICAPDLREGRPLSPPVAPLPPAAPSAPREKLRARARAPRFGTRGSPIPDQLDGKCSACFGVRHHRQVGRGRRTRQRDARRSGCALQEPALYVPHLEASLPKTRQA